MKSRLSFFETLAICIGSLVGMDIFIATSLVASMVGQGFGLWVLVFPFAILSGLCFAELSSMFKVSGGPVVFVKAAFGDFFAFLSGWAFWTTASITISSLSLAIPFYMSFFMALSPLNSMLISLFIVWVFTAVNYTGVKSSAGVQKALVLASLLVFLAFIVLGFPQAKAERLYPPFPGLAGGAMLFVFATFIGWESATIIAEEVKEPRKSIPKAILLSTIFISAIYLLVAFVSFGSVPIEALASSALSLYPVLSFLPWVALFIAVGGVLINASALNSWILTAARLPYAMAKQGIFLKYFLKLSKHGTPSRSLALQAVFSSLIVLGGTYENSVLLLLSNALILYVLNFLALIKLKKKIKDAAFKLPIAIPVISIIFLLFLLSQINLFILFSGVMILLLGIPAYVLIKLTTDIAFIEKFYDSFSALFYFMQPLWYGKGEREKVLRNAKLSKSSVVLDYGCGSGYTTAEIAKRSKKVLAVDISRKQLERAIKNLSGVDNVIFLKESEMGRFKPSTFDRIVCSIAMDHFTKPQKQLSQLSRVLKRGGVASFLAFGNSLGIMPKEFLRHDSSVKRVFENAGFSKISIERVKRLGSEYIYMTAKK